MMKKNSSLVDTTLNAFNGIRVLLKEKATKREIFVLVISIAILSFKPNIYSVLLFVLSWLLLAAEALNTAIERICDMFTKNYDERIKSIKDVSSASVIIIVFAQISLLLLWIFFE